MVDHLVLFKLKPGTPGPAAQAMLDALHGLRGQVDGIVELSAGENFSTERSKGFTHGLWVRFRNREALRAYIPHPAHQKVVKENVLPIMDDLIVVDYEC